MNIREYIRYAHKILNEDSGSEGLEYNLRAKKGLKSYKDDLIIIDEVKEENGETIAKVKFSHPHDYGTALNVIKEALEDIDITSLSLVY